MRHFKAIAAMAENRVIGAGNRLPWHLPEDFKWFKRMTTGQVIVMGRKTYESIGKPLPNRTTLVLSRSAREIPGVRVISSLAEIDLAHETREVYICGGAEIYAQALPLCSDVYLTLVKRSVPGDRFFPPFEDQFVEAEVVMDNPEFRITHYRRK
jgi:dihydrofolate reductase